DSLASKARFKAWQSWVSVSNSLFGSTSAQYILCPSVKYFRQNHENHFHLYAPLRFVFKSPLINSFFETQYEYDSWSSDNSLAAVLGLYFQLYKGLWVDYQASYEANLTEGTSALDHNLKLEFTLPFTFEN
ncbi:MAG: hypothetical protein ACP5F3_06070, partial [Candidatus Syntrophosphaera sp.]